MSRSFILLVFVAIVFVTGCATASKLSELRPGMERADVIKIMGTPYSTGFIDGGEHLYYRLQRSGHEAYMTRGLGGQEYAVRLVNGRVESYGRAQDIRTGP